MYFFLQLQILKIWGGEGDGDMVMVVDLIKKERVG